MRRSARRWAIGAVAGVVATLATASGVSAYWHAQQTMNVGTVKSGDLNVTAAWVGDPPDWADLYPGSVAEADLAVSVTGTGDNLEWTVDVTAQNLDPAFSFQAWEGSCGSETAMPATGSPEQLTVCVRFTLMPSDDSLQGRIFKPRIVVTANQVAG